jgi:prephenate dehydratase
MIAFQGINGSYSQEALNEYMKKWNLNFKSIETEGFFKELFLNILELGLGFIPIENSYAGSVTEVYKYFDKYDIQIIGEYVFNVRHCLLAKKESNIDDIKVVYSHPQALSQTSNYIEKMNFKTFSFNDTAGAAKFIKESKGNNMASISSFCASRIYDLKILKEDIQDSKNNQTRFVLVKRKDFNFSFEKDLLKDKNKTSIIIKTKDIPGALYKCLGAFATNNINLCKLESQPSRDKNFDYIFYIDFEADVDEKRVKLALEEIEFFTESLKILGSYKKDV